MRPAAALALAAALAACARPRPGDLPQVRPGQTACARCGMIVTEERYSAGYVDEEGRSVVFDDLGEYLAAAAQNPALARAAFVHDAETGRWARAEAAVVIRVEGLATPMGSGYAAFADPAAARRFLAARAGGGLAQKRQGTYNR